MITRFDGAYRFLSNFYPCPVIFEGTVWLSAEHAFQAAKSLDTAYRHQILTAGTPGAAKRLGRGVTLRPDWERVKVPVMCEVLSAKFASPYLASLLRATGTVPFAEGNAWHDQYWGTCWCEQRPECAPPGRNVLGLLLTVTRAALP